MVWQWVDAGIVWGGVGKDGVLSVPPLSLTRVVEPRQEKVVCGEMTD